MRNKLVVVLLSFPLLATASEQEVRDLIFQDVISARDAAQAVEAATYAPRNFERGLGSLATAERSFQVNRPLDRIRNELSEATQYFRTAEKVATKAQEQFAGLIKLRQAAGSVNAGLHDGENWQLAERKFKEAIIEFERGDIRLADRRAGEAETPYRQAELAGIKAAYLNDTRRLLRQADKARADRYAPATYNRAQELLATAEKELTENRYDIDRPRDLARQAQYEARHALYLAGEVERFRKEKTESEALILAGERPLRQIAGVTDQAVGFDQGYEVATVMIMDYIKNLQSQQRNTEQDLYDRVAQVEALQTQLSSLETRLGGVSEERQAMEEQLARQAREREQFARIETMFARDQADVLRSGGDIIIRLVGTSFPVGKATIEPSAYSLLATLMRSMDVFPESKITIEGHTDAFGGDELNMKLSQERADAVRAYLLANMQIAESRLAANGYGETRPIANNETREGRARNRRIDVVIRPRMRATR
ncbi:MAG: OmpA family protein [Gammaproteobacteria bacterium]|nr:OmpA family protein [Gammaproteobacteria bacterium]